MDARAVNSEDVASFEFRKDPSEERSKSEPSRSKQRERYDDEDDEDWNDGVTDATASLFLLCFQRILQYC
jgi:hypothetical protein